MDESRGGRSGGAAKKSEATAALRDFIAHAEGLSPSDVTIRNWRGLGGGASRLLWSLDVELAGRGPDGGSRNLPLVVRQDPPGRVVAGGMEAEFSLLQAAGEAGVPVPEVHWCGADSSVLGSPFFVMERLDGEAIPRRILREDRYAGVRSGLAAELGQILARIHEIDPDHPELKDRLDRPRKGGSPASSQVAQMAQGVRFLAVEPHPVLDLAERWLRNHLPPDSTPRVVHGDYRLGNVMIDDAGVRAILDWELSHVGDPIEDLGWLCVRAWRFGSEDQEAAGVGSREAFVAAYEEASGTTVDRDALLFWEVYGNLKLALVFITQARAYLDGGHRTIELASLGRRIAEAEAELLDLIEEER